jgi:hypothetical protein
LSYKISSFFRFLEDWSKTFWKIESVNKAFLFWYWHQPKKYFFRNQSFLFFKIEGWNVQHLFEIKFRETSQNFNSFSLLRQLLFLIFSIGCLIEFQTASERFSFLSWKTKKFYFRKKYFLSRCQNQNKQAWKLSAIKGESNLSIL